MSDDIQRIQADLTKIAADITWMKECLKHVQYMAATQPASTPGTLTPSKQPIGLMEES